MTNPNRESVFNRSGFATLSDLNSSEYRRVFFELDEEQALFSSKQRLFLSDEYKWPHKPLHNFSRVWEYPYVYHHLGNYFQALPAHPRPKVADVGSGVTFFPFALAKLGYQVVCTDIDPVCERDLLLACQHISASPGAVDFRLIEGSDLPFKDSECDAVCCISVIEHISDFGKTVNEVARILKPGGLCLLTCDINFEPEDGLQLDGAQYAQLRYAIDAAFLPVYRELTIHPIDVLTTFNSPYSLGPRLGVFKLVYQLIKQKIVKPLVGRKRGIVNNVIPHLGVVGLALTK